MQSLDALVKSGKVLYLGISDTPGERFVPTCSQSWADQVGQLGWCRKRTSMLAAKAWLNSSSKMSHTSRIMRAMLNDLVKDCGTSARGRSRGISSRCAGIRDVPR